MEDNQTNDKLEMLMEYRSLIKFYGGDYDLSGAVLNEDLIDEVDAEIDFYLEQSLDLMQDTPIISIN